MCIVGVIGDLNVMLLVSLDGCYSFVDLVYD